MDSIHNILLNVAVCLYAVLGFSLSVLTSLLGLLSARQPPKLMNIPPKPHLQPLVPRNRPVPRTLRSCSDKPSTTAKPAAPILDDKQRRRKMLASHRRSRSIPLITLDYFGSAVGGTEVENALPVRKPLTFVIPPPPGREREYPRSAGYDTEKSGFRLANLFSTERKREKEKMQKIRERRPSLPPALVPQLEGPAKQPQASRKRRKSEVSKTPLLGQGNVVRPQVRRVSSAPTEERLTMKFDLTFSRTVEKKKSGTLRTQPYEAPFFCPPPVQPTRLKSQSTLDLTSPSTMKT